MNKRGRTGRKKAQTTVKDDDDDEQSPDEEIEYLESDESEEEPEPEPSTKSKYVQPPVSEWIPRHTDTALQTTDRVLRILFFKPPVVRQDQVQSSSQTEIKPRFTSSSAHYTVLDRTGRPVDRYKAEQFQTPPKRRVQ